MTRCPPRDEQGAAVVVAIGLVAVLVFVASLCLGTVAIVVDHRRVQAAADLAALAGAAELQRGGDPCAAASRIGLRHQVTVVGCLVDGSTVLVVTSLSLPPVVGGHSVQARARAGPATAGDGAGLAPTPAAPR